MNSYVNTGMFRAIQGPPHLLMPAAMRGMPGSVPMPFVKTNSAGQRGGSFVRTARMGMPDIGSQRGPSAAKLFASRGGLNFSGNATARAAAGLGAVASAASVFGYSNAAVADNTDSVNWDKYDKAKEQSAAAGRKLDQAYDRAGQALDGARESSRDLELALEEAQSNLNQMYWGATAITGILVLAVLFVAFRPFFRKPKKPSDKNPR